MLLRVLIARLSDRGQLLELRKPRVEHAEALKLPRSAKLRGQPLRHGGSVIGAVPVDVGVRNEIACRRLYPIYDESKPSRSHEYILQHDLLQRKQQ